MLFTFCYLVFTSRRYQHFYLTLCIIFSGGYRYVSGHEVVFQDRIYNKKRIKTIKLCWTILLCSLNRSECNYILFLIYLLIGRIIKL